MTLGGANTYSGGTTLNAGQLNINNAAALGATAGTFVVNGGTIDNTSGAAVTLNNYPQTWAADINFAGSNSLNMGTGAIAMTGNRAVTVGASTLTVGGAISGTGNLAKQGGGTLTLVGANAYTGSTTVSAGTLQMGALAAPYNAVAHYAFDGNANDATGNGNNGTAVASPTYSTGRFGQAITLNGTSQYVTVPGSTGLQLNAYTVSAWVNIAAQPAVNGGGGPALVSTRNNGDTTFDMQYWHSATSTYQLHADIGNGSGWIVTNANATLSGPLSGWNLVTYAVDSNGYSIYLNGSQVGIGSYSGLPLFMKAGEVLSFGSQQGGGAGYGAAGYINGSMDDITVIGGKLTGTQVNNLYLGQLGQLPSATAAFVAAGATLDLNGTSQTVASLNDVSGAGGQVTNSQSGGALTLTVTPSTVTTFSGVIHDGSGPTALTVNGASTGAMVLTGANTYTGATLIRGGVLAVPTGGSISATSFLDTSGPSGAELLVAGGTVTTTGVDRIGLAQAGNTTAIGTVYLTAGSISASQDSNAGFNAVTGGSATGFVYQTGGSYTQAGGAFYIGVLNASGSATGTYNMSGGTFTTGPLNVGGGGAVAGANSTLNVNGGLFTAGGFNSGNANTATVNLGGGTLVTPAWATGATNTTLNFNGGTLRAGASSVAFLGTAGAVNIYSGGATIDTNGANITIGQTFQNPANKGVTSVSVTDTVDVFSAPTAVSFTGGSGTIGSGYTVLDSSGHITGVVVTSPGSYSSDPTGVVIAGVSNAGNVSSPTITTAANNAGGLTKIGAGTLTLSGANTFAGNVLVSTGGLQITNPNALSGVANPITVASGATLDFQAQTITLPNQPVNISGAGYAAGGYTGAIHLGGGANSVVTVPGQIVLGANSTIKLDGNTRLTASGGINIAGNMLTLAGDGGSTISITGITGTTGGVTSAANIVNVSGASYSGATQINGGTFAFSGSNSINPVTVNGGTLASGTIGTGGDGSISGNIVAGTGAYVIAPGGAGTTGTLSVGGITTSANTTFNFDLGAAVSGGSYSGDLINLTGSGFTIGRNRRSRLQRLPRPAIIDCSAAISARGLPRRSLAAFRFPRRRAPPSTASALRSTPAISTWSSARPVRARQSGTRPLRGLGVRAAIGPTAFQPTRAIPPRSTLVRLRELPAPLRSTPTIRSATSSSTTLRPLTRLLRELAAR